MYVYIYLIPLPTQVTYTIYFWGRGTEVGSSFGPRGWLRVCSAGLVPGAAAGRAGQGRAQVLIFNV